MQGDRSYQSLINLINEYIICGDYALSLLKKKYKGNEAFLYAWKVLKLIPKEGSIENVYFNFHGRGCYFEFKEDAIDIDFGPYGRFDGFDLFKLKQFLSYRIDRFPLLSDDKELEFQFYNLINEGIISKHPLEPQSHLYYLISRI